MENGVLSGDVQVVQISRKPGVVLVFLSNKDHSTVAVRLNKEQLASLCEQVAYVANVQKLAGECDTSIFSAAEEITGKRNA